jgi:signal transduction histidine kinase
MPFGRSEDHRVVAGVCGGVASMLVVDATLVRLAFALLALAGGAGILLYLALWTYGDARRPWFGQALIAVSAIAFMLALGFSAAAVLGAGLLVAGGAVVLARGGSLRPGGSLPVLGIALTMAGAVTLLGHLGPRSSLIAPGALGGALLLVFVPWLWQVAGQRTERIRLQERADVAARVHDSVLQTLTLIQRNADDPKAVQRYARRQERNLRELLYRPAAATGQFSAALEKQAAEVEDAYGVAIEVVVVGDCTLDERTTAVVEAAREAMVNAAKSGGVDEFAVFAEVESTEVTVFVRDRGKGFDLDAIPPSRAGIRESIVGRMQRVGGVATVRTAPGEGTEVKLSLTRQR